jgi:hypothetical protein
MIVRNGRVISKGHHPEGATRARSSIAWFPEAQPETFEACREEIAGFDLTPDHGLVLLACVAHINLNHFRETGEGVTWASPEHLHTWISNYDPEAAERYSIQQIARFKDELWKAGYLVSHKGPSIDLPHFRLLICLEALGWAPEAVE